MLAVVALADLQKFRDAADKLQVSKPTLTRLIQKAEADLGAKIFERTSRGLVVTPVGREVVARCRDLVVEVDGFWRNIDQIRNSGGTLSIGCGHLAARSIVEPAMLALMQNFPDFRVRIDVRANKDSLRGLLDQSIDVFVGDLTHTPEFAGLKIEVLKRYDVIFVAGSDHPVHQMGPQTLGQLLQYPIVMARLHKYWRGVFQQALLDQGHAGNEPFKIPTIECDDFALTCNLVARSEFLTAGIRENFAEFLDCGTLRQIHVKTPLVWSACAARRANSEFPSLDAFWRILMEMRSEQALHGRRDWPLAACSFLKP